MSYTKGELVEMALEEIGIASYEFDISPEQTSSAIRRLDAMMAKWNAKGILLSYPIAKGIDSASTDDSGIPDWSWEAVITNLGIRLAPSYGKTVALETKIAAKQSYNTLCGIFTKPKEMQFPSMPKGAGYKGAGSPYTPVPVNIYLDAVDETIDPSGEPE